MPVVSPETLVSRLAKGAAVPAVLLLGSDAYLRETCRGRLVDASLDLAGRDWSVCRFSAADDELGLALGQARTFPMLVPRQVVIIAELDAVDHFDDDERDAALADLTAYLADPAPFTVLILEAAALDQRMKLAKLLAEKTLVVAAELPENPVARLQAAAALAEEMARAQNAVLDPDASEELADLCNSDLAAIHTEIAKLSTYVGPGRRIQRADIGALVVSEKKHSVWELADMLAARQRASAFVFLNNLLNEGEAPPALVGAMAWMFRKLLEAQDLGAHVHPGQAAGRLGMRPGAAELAMKQARKIPRKQLLDGLRALYDADSSLKSRSKDQRAIMEFLVARLTGTSA